MRLLVCCSRSWFKLSEEINDMIEVKFITREEDFTLESID